MIYLEVNTLAFISLHGLLQQIWDGNQEFVAHNQLLLLVTPHSLHRMKIMTG